MRQKKEPCPKCGKLVELLDTHLHNSAICRTCQQLPAQTKDQVEPLGTPKSILHLSVPTPHLRNHPSLTALPSKCGSSSYQLTKGCRGMAEGRLFSSWISRMSMEREVNVMNRMCCTSESMTTLPGRATMTTFHHISLSINERHQHPPVHSPHQRTLKVVKEEKKQAKKQLRALRRDSSKPEDVRGTNQSPGAAIQQTCPRRETQGEVKEQPM